MGTDIHAFVETDPSGDFDTTSNIHSLTHGSFILQRDYNVFDALAGARDSQIPADDRDPSKHPLVPERGMPTPRSQSVSQAFFYLVDDPISTIGSPDKYFWPSERCINPDDAEDWVANHNCIRSEVVQWFNGNHLWPAVSARGLFCPTWLTPQEFDRSLDHHKISLDSLAVEYRILHSALSLAEDSHGVGCVRLVLWFDH